MAKYGASSADSVMRRIPGRPKVTVEPNRDLRRRVRTMPQLLADDIRRQLVDGSLKPGDPLASAEQELLMDSYRVARPTLREAIRILEAESLIETHRGKNGGVIVRAPDPKVVIRQVGVLLQLVGTTLADIYTTRAAVELAGLRLLAAKATEADIAAISEITFEGLDCLNRTPGRLRPGG